MCSYFCCTALVLDFFESQGVRVGRSLKKKWIWQSKPNCEKTQMKSVIIQYYHLRHSLYLLCNLFPFLDYSLLAWYLVINHMVIGFAFIFFQVLDMMLYNSCRSSNCYSDKYSNRYMYTKNWKVVFSVGEKWWDRDLCKRKLPRGGNIWTKLWRTHRSFPCR